MWAKLMSEQPVTFKALIDALRAKEELISEEEALRFVEALGQQVQALRDDLPHKDNRGGGFYLAAHLASGGKFKCAVDCPNCRLTALLGKREGQ
jgi:hypothetical protein